MKLHRLAWAAGLVGLPLSHYWLVAQIEPFYTSIYCFLWWSYIFAVDFAVFRLRGRSLLRDQPREFLFLSIWSVLVWLVFEMGNLRLHDWYYVMSPYGFSWSTTYLVLAFATVLPGVFETTELVLALMERFIPGGLIRGRPFAVTRLNIVLQLALGIAMLVLTLAFPRQCFCLVWGCAYFLTDPVCYWLQRGEKDHTGRSLLGQLASGDNTRLIALLVAGFICGGLWESWNLGARTKWIYSVPFFDELKIGEMPVLGFLGFPPFALECYTMVNALSMLRDGRNWELSAQENAARRGMSAITLAICAVLVPFGVLAASAAIATGGTIVSYATPLDWYFFGELGERGVKALDARHALQCNQFLKLKDCPQEIDRALFERLRRLSRMSEMKGIGLENAIALEKLKINLPEDLAKRNPDELASRLRSMGENVRLEEVKIWIRAAKKVRPRE